MYLLFEPTKQGIRYAAFTSQAELVYGGFCVVSQWSAREFHSVFTQELLSKIRGHGKVFTHIGIIVPYADRRYVKPISLRKDVLRFLLSSPLLQKTNQALEYLSIESQKAWPHLTPVLLFDTFLSDRIEKYMFVPPFSYDDIKSYAIEPILLHSYGHKANVHNNPSNQYVLSLYVDNQVSLAVFKGDELIDASPSYSPFSSIMSLYSPGLMDVGFVLKLQEKKRLSDVIEIFVNKSGLQPMTETQFDLPVLLQLSGMVPRTDNDLVTLPIETMEWIELSVRSFIRSLRQAIGGMMADKGVKSLIINTSIVPKSSGLWKLICQGVLSELKVTYCETTLLQAACEDLITHTSNP